MAITERTLTGLRTAAMAGDSRAAQELGRLLCMTASDPQGTDEDGELWPEDRWLRQAVAARGDDVEALTLLAGRLAQQAHHWENTFYDAEADKAAATARRLRTEAEQLYARIRAAGHAAVAASGLDELAELLELSDAPAADNTYSFHVFHDEGWSGSVCHTATIVASDADEIRWAIGEWLTLSEGGMGTLQLATYLDGSVAGSIDLAEYLDGEIVAWDKVAIPELSGTPLPVGLPVPGLGLYYGFSGGAE